MPVAPNDVLASDIAGGTKPPWVAHMRLFGRITVYGEYLMHDQTSGLVTASNLYMATSEDPEAPVHVEYDFRKDEVAAHLQRHGRPFHKVLRGNLPLGYGFASSTIISFLNLQRRLPSRQLERAVLGIDMAIHGFRPSGADFEFCLKQKTGLYGPNGWTDVGVRRPHHSVVLWPQRGEMVLPEVRCAVLERGQELTQLAQALNAGVLNCDKLDYPLLLEYARVLRECHVYAPDVDEFVAEMLGRGIVAKATGGLYDKAVLLVWQDKPGPTEAIWDQIRSYRPSSFLA